jgi:hypothetical protein
MFHRRFNLNLTKFFKFMKFEAIDLAPYSFIELLLKYFINKINQI